MEKEFHNVSPVTVEAVITELKSLEDRDLFVVLQMINALKQHTRGNYSEWTEEDFYRFSSEVLRRGWSAEDSVYDNL